jgi:chemotaxis protein MotB
MASKRKKKQPEGAPDWILTYGDMMSLLLAFFIMLASLSEPKKEDEFKVIVEIIKENLGVRSGGGKIPIDHDPTMSLRKRLEKIQLNQKKDKDPSFSIDPATQGKSPAVKIVRPGMLFIVGSRITFEPGSADLNNEARGALQEIAELVRGTNNKIIVAGHADASEVTVLGTYEDLWQLSFARAAAVQAYLVSDELGIRPERFRLEANADREPLKNRVVIPARQRLNRRVEVIKSESLVEEFTQPEQDR